MVTIIAKSLYWKVNTKRLGSMLIVQKQRQSLEELLRNTHMTEVMKTKKLTLLLKVCV